MADNPFLEGCTEPMGVPKRLLLATAIGIVVALALFSLERHVFHQDDTVSGVVTGVGALLVAGLSFVALGGVRDRCDLRDTFDFYTEQGAPPNVAKALTLQLGRSESLYFIVLLTWVYTCVRVGKK